VPFFLQPVLTGPTLIQPDRLHPTAQGIEGNGGATVDQVAGAVPKISARPLHRPVADRQTAASPLDAAKGASSVPVSQTCAPPLRRRSNSASRRSGVEMGGHFVEQQQAGARGRRAGRRGPG
jgi:hypothetical protein